jgi:hypothetical protein
VLAVRDGRTLGELGQGNLVGSALILTGRSAEVDAVAAGPVRMCGGASKRCRSISRRIPKPARSWSVTWLMTSPRRSKA